MKKIMLKRNVFMLAFAFRDGAHKAGEYAYDANGNLTMDANKGIVSVTYDELNHPLSINFEGTTENGTRKTLFTMCCLSFTVHPNSSASSPFFLRGQTP